MKSKVSLMAAPTGLSPGGYVPKAYAERNTPNTAVADVEAVRTATGVWRIRVIWECRDAVHAIGDDVDRFVDAAAVLSPSVADAPFMTMGAPGKGVEGALWRPDRADLIGVRAEGLGSVERSSAAESWSARAEWASGRWQVDFSLKGFAALDRHRLLAIAIWQGAHGDRAGLKSVSPGWLEVAT